MPGKRPAPYAASGMLVVGSNPYLETDPPIVAMDLEGEPISVLFDTGATLTTMDMELAQRRLGVQPTSQGMEPAGKVSTASGEMAETYNYTFKSLKISGIAFQNVTVLLGKFSGRPQVVLGINELKHLHLYFSFGERVIHVTGADAKRQ